MSKKTVFAWTEPKGTFPAFVNLTETENGDVVISVRNRRASLPSDVTIPKTAFAEMQAAIAAHGSKPEPKKPTTKK